MSLSPSRRRYLERQQRARQYVAPSDTPVPKGIAGKLAAFAHDQGLLPEPIVEPPKPATPKRKRLSVAITADTREHIKFIADASEKLVLAGVFKHRGGRATVESIVEVALAQLFERTERRWLQRFDPEELARRDAQQAEREAEFEAMVEETLNPTRFYRKLAKRVEEHLAREQASEAGGEEEACTR
jgi:hypothetical protein